MPLHHLVCIGTLGGFESPCRLSKTADTMGHSHMAESVVYPRRFELVRKEDESGVSGTGVVAYGIEYPDGAVHMQWKNAENSHVETNVNGCSFKPAPSGVADTISVHGHGGKTEIRWIDDIEGRYADESD